MQDAIANVLKDDVNNKLVASPYISILLDESCDISVTKKLLIYAKTISSDFDIETHFLDNLQISDGTAKTIYQSVKNALQERNISLNKVLAVGSDGASVMTGRKNGFVALLKKQDSPYVIGIHCIAHRLALCSSQAADKVPYLKQYQQILSDIFYHFKRSALRRTKINAIQALLAPLQTATVERGFSIQNEIKVSARNRLSAPRLNTLMQIAHGPEIEAFDFDSALKKWKESKRRKLFSAPN